MNEKRLYKREQRINPATDQMEEFYLLSASGKKPDEPEWGKLFACLTDQFIEDFANSTFGVYMWFFREILQRPHRGETAQVIILPTGYQKIAKSLGLTTRSVSEKVRWLVKKGYLLRPNRNQYVFMVPGKFLCKGELQKVEQMQLSFDYEQLTGDATDERYLEE